MNPDLKWTHEHGAKLLEESWSLFSRETIQNGWRFTADTDSASIAETDRSVNESSDSDEKYREAESEDTEPSSTGMSDRRFDANEPESHGFCP
jgi:hypothetical protein